jgi:hypothetical protein
VKGGKSNAIWSPSQVFESLSRLSHLLFLSCNAWKSKYSVACLSAYESAGQRLSAIFCQARSAGFGGKRRQATKANYVKLRHRKLPSALWPYVNFYSTAGAQACGFHIKTTGHNPPRGPSAMRWVPTTAAAGTNGLTCLPKHGAVRDNKFFVTHPMTDQCCLTKRTV